ncbi:MAG: phosphate ABC transporter permease subunit PstC [Gemmatales bacterium]|nr:phosphate ABC transporter permease subunit PstC [Gemmatales bacterium]MDW8388183.1 phosphate ABC transporter permease subunit PstC [Gemmatales bacterium]
MEQGLGPPAAVLSASGPPERSTPPRRRLGDVVFFWLCRGAALAVVLIFILLGVFLVIEAWPAIRSTGWDFFRSTEWNPQTDQYGALAFIFGTLATSAIALAIAVPLGVGTAVFLAEIAPRWIRTPGSFLVELLAAIPSVVYGFWGLMFLAPVVQNLFDLMGQVIPGLKVPNTGGMGIFTAGLVLAVMVLPYVAAVSFDVCRAVPRSQADAALALGATRWHMIWTVILPYARPGIIGGCFLALGRALGETMAVTMLIGNRPEINFSLFAVGDSIASVIANQLNEAETDLQRAALVELGLILLLVTVAVNVLARVLIWRVSEVRSARGWLDWLRRRNRTVLEREATANGRPTVTVPRQPRRLARVTDRIMTGILACCLAISIGPLLLILGYILYRGIGALNWDFFTKLPAPAGEPGGGLAHAMLGSLMLVGLATAFAVPLAILSAVHLAEYRNSRLGPVVRFINELLGGVPSIVIGIFAYALLVRPLGHFSGWAGAFALGVMMIPIVMRTTEEALKMVPDSLRNASLALGATTWQTILRVTLPAALPAVLTGVFLGISRIAGETAPLLLTAYNSNYWPESPSQPTPFLPYYIFYYSRSGYAEWERQAWAAALVLLAVVMVINVSVRMLMGQRVLLASRAD